MATSSSKIRVALALLLACAAATFSDSHAARVSSAGGLAPAPLVGDSKQLGLPWIPIIPPIFGGGGSAADPELLRCVKSIMGAEDCVSGLLESLFSGKINLTKDCCLAIDGLSEHCFSSIFPVPVIGSVFPALVKSFCAAPALPPSI